MRDHKKLRTFELNGRDRESFKRLDQVYARALTAFSLQPNNRNYKEIR